MAYQTADQLREAIGKPIEDEGKFPDSRLEDLVAEFESRVENYRGVAYELRYAVDRHLIDVAGTWLRLRWPEVRSITSIVVTDPAIDGTATTVETDEYTFDAAGWVKYPAGFIVDSLVTVTYTHGLGSRQVTDGVTASNPTVTSATAAFTVADIGKPISGSGIPARTTISAVNSTTSVTISAAATATASSVTITIGEVPDQLVRACRLYVRSCALSDQTTVGRDVITQGLEGGGYTRYSTPDMEAGRPTGYLEVDALLNSLPDRRRIA